MRPHLRKWRFPEWQPEYEAAIAETDIDKLKVKTAALEDAIFNRCQRIAGKLGYETERDAIQLAIDTLARNPENQAWLSTLGAIFKEGANRPF